MKDAKSPLLRGQNLGAAAFIVTLTIVAVAGLGPRHDASERLLPHGYCFSWDPTLVRLHVVSDVLIGLAYTAIPLALIHFIRRRTDLPFNWMFLLFGLFIVACGATHWMAVWTLWNPSYWMSGSVKAVTAAASVPTAILLYYLIPQALAIPSVQQLRDAKEALEREIGERRRAEQALREAHDELEVRVKARTEELTAANRQLTEQRLALEVSDRRKSEFLAILSHELRNPVHAIHTCAQVIGMAAKEPLLKETSESIGRQVAQLTQHLDDLLSVVKGEYEPGHLDRRPVDLRSVVRDAVETVSAAARGRQQTIRWEQSAEDIAVSVDPLRMVQALVNVLRNACAYSDAGQPIDVAIRVEDGAACVDVTDYGIGLDATEKERLFELFTRGERAKRKSATGLGIGLHVARRIVHAHGGRIEVSSAGIGSGSTFRIALPLYA